MIGIEFTIDEESFDHVYDGRTDGTNWNGHMNVTVDEETRAAMLQDPALDDEEREALAEIPAINGWINLGGGAFVLVTEALRVECAQCTGTVFVRRDWQYEEHWCSSECEDLWLRERARRQREDDEARQELETDR